MPRALQPTECQSPSVSHRPFRTRTLVEKEKGSASPEQSLRIGAGAAIGRNCNSRKRTHAKPALTKGLGEVTRWAAEIDPKPGGHDANPTMAPAIMPVRLTCRIDLKATPCDIFHGCLPIPIPFNKISKTGGTGHVPISHTMSDRAFPCEINKLDADKQFLHRVDR